MGNIVKTLAELHNEGYTLFHGRQLSAIAKFTLKDDERPILSSIQLQVHDNQLIGVATDRFRLAKFTFANVVPHQDDAAFLIDWVAARKSGVVTTSPKWNRICGIRDGGDNNAYDFVAGNYDEKSDLVCNIGYTRIPRVIGEFPKYQMLLGDGNGKPNDGRGPLMNAGFVADAVSAIEVAYHLDKDNIAVVEVVHGNDLDPFILHGWNQTGAIDGEGVVLLMPIRR